MKIIGIDQSVGCTGMVIVDADNFGVLAEALIKPVAKLKPKRARVSDVYEKFKTTLTTWKGTIQEGETVIVAREADIPNMQNSANASAGEIYGIVDLACLHVFDSLIQNETWFEIPAGVWRKLVYGRGTSPMPSGEKKKHPDRYCGLLSGQLKEMGLDSDWKVTDLVDAYSIAVAARTIFYVVNGRMSLVDLRSDEQREALVDEKKRKKANRRLKDVVSLDVRDQKKFLKEF